MVAGLRPPACRAAERRLGGGACLAVALGFLAAACVRPPVATLPDADTGTARLITLDALRPLPRVRLSAIRTYEVALGAALSVMETEMRFPPLSTSVHVFPNRAALERDLVGGGYAPAEAARVAAALDGVSSADRIRVNHASMERLAWPSRVRLLAHELTHVAEYQLSEGRRTGSEQWLREGFAEWVAYKVLEVLGSRSLSFERDAAILALQPASRTSALPLLSQLASTRDWIAAIERERPAAPVYRVAFLATDELVSRRGVQSVLRYFALCARSDDGRENFRQAFGEPAAEFQGRTERRLARFIEAREAPDLPPARPTRPGSPASGR